MARNKSIRTESLTAKVDKAGTFSYSPKQIPKITDGRSNRR